MRSNVRYFVEQQSINEVTGCLAKVIDDWEKIRSRLVAESERAPDLRVFVLSDKAFVKLRVSEKKRSVAFETFLTEKLKKYRIKLCKWQPWKLN